MQFSSNPGTNEAKVEVTHISAHGLWLLIENIEYFLAHDTFPWFKDAPIGKVLNVVLAAPGHVRWPELDVDLSLEILHHPEHYPLLMH